MQIKKIEIELNNFNQNNNSKIYNKELNIKQKDKNFTYKKEINIKKKKGFIYKIKKGFSIIILSIVNILD